MNAEKIQKIFFIVLGCIWLALVVLGAGCGGVSTVGLDMDAGQYAWNDAGSTAGVGAHPDAGVAGSSGTAGSAGAPGRPLGAGCTSDDQCGSNVCAKSNPADVSGSCCDGRPDKCTQCVGGYKVPLSDGTGCGPELCDGTDRKWNLCKAGACTAQVVQCATALCDKAGNKICPGNTAQTPAGCALEDNPCYCYDSAGSGHTSYPCP